MKPIQQKAIEFIYIVKQTFKNQPSKFNEFAKILRALKLEENHTVLISKLKSLFESDHPDLLCGLNQFLPTKYDEDMEDKKLCTGKGKHSWLLRESPSELFDKIRDRCVENNDDEFRVLINFSETVLRYHEKKISFYEADKIFKDLLRDDPDLYIECNRVVAQSVEDKSSSERSELLRRNWKGGEEDKSWGEKESDSGGYCSLYEETMDVKEFYLFEMDLNFSRLESTIQKLQKHPHRLQECLTVLDFKCIKNLYNDSDDGACGEEMVDILKSDPVGRLVARVVVLERLRQKKMQLEHQKLRLDTIWNEIFQDIIKKGRVCRHREFLCSMEKASINGFKQQKQ